MEKLKIYLDNCCYNRPFDDLSQAMVKNEANAKMYIQSLIKFKSLDLYSSFMLLHEISQSSFEDRKQHIMQFVNVCSSFHVSRERENEVILRSEEIMKTGIKYKDAVHLACSMIAGCDYFITTDKRLLNYKTDKIKIVNPIDFVTIWEEMS